MTVATYSSCFTDEDSRFVASISPETIISLLDALDAAERELDAYKRANEGGMVFVDGDFGETAMRFHEIARAERAERERDDAERSREWLTSMLESAQAESTASIVRSEKAERERDEARADIARVASTVFEPVTLPDGMPPLVDRIVGAIERIYRERTDARSGEHVAFAEISELHRAINALESEVTAQRSRAKKAEQEADRLRTEVERLRSVCSASEALAMRIGAKGGHGYYVHDLAMDVLARVNAAKKGGE